MPPSFKPTVGNIKPQSGRRPRRRLLFLGATAAIASSLGVGLGSALRFQMPVGQSPLFKPQQDFPPLAEWPPQIPPATELDDFGTDWEKFSPSSQLVYNDRPDEEAEVYELDEEPSLDEKQDVENLARTEENFPNPIPVTLDRTDSVQDTTDEVFEDGLTPVVSASTGELDDELTPIDTPQIDNGTPAPHDIDSWFDKQPASKTQFSDGPALIAPDELSPFPEPSSD
ncbi:MAG: hypothetical protein AAGA46_08515 [Cyanobacteria bacterium P01_F01_bin.13]